MGSGLIAGVDNSIGVVTALVPVLGYKPSTALAAEALRSGKGVVELVREKGLLSEEQIAQVESALFQPQGMVLVTGPTGSGKSTSLYSMLTIFSGLIPRSSNASVITPVPGPSSRTGRSSPKTSMASGWCATSVATSVSTRRASGC